MARHIGPVVKKQRRFGLLPDAPGVSGPGAGFQGKKQSRPRRKSEYGVRLDEKQKLKFIYGILEKQFRRYFANAQKNPANTGTILLQQLELRLDNLVYRLGFAKTRPAARQLVNHGHVLVDNKKVDVASFQVQEGQIVTLKPSGLEILQVQEMLKETKPESLPTWLTRKGPVGMVKSQPGADDLRVDIDLQHIIEYYSR